MLHARERSVTSLFTCLLAIRSKPKVNKMRRLCMIVKKMMDNFYQDNVV